MQHSRWEEKPTELSEEDRDYYLEKVSFFWNLFLVMLLLVQRKK
jgi:hypothetical protein